MPITHSRPCKRPRAVTASPLGRAPGRRCSACKPCLAEQRHPAKDYAPTRKASPEQGTRASCGSALRRRSAQSTRTPVSHHHPPGDCQRTALAQPRRAIGVAVEECVSRRDDSHRTRKGHNAAIEDPPVIARLLAHLSLPTRAPPRSRERPKCREIGPLRLINSSNNPAQERVFTRHTCDRPPAGAAL